MIPIKLRSEMSEDKYYTKCCIDDECSGKIEWHHNLIFKGQQVNEKWCIIPVCKKHHDLIHGSSEYKEMANFVMLNRTTDEELLKYSKAINYLEMKKRLNEIYV